MTSAKIILTERIKAVESGKDSNYIFNRELATANLQYLYELVNALEKEGIETSTHSTEGAFDFVRCNYEDVSSHVNVFMSRVKSELELVFFDMRLFEKLQMPKQRYTVEKGGITEDGKPEPDKYYPIPFTPEETAKIAAMQHDLWRVQNRYRLFTNVINRQTNWHLIPKHFEYNPKETSIAETLGIINKFLITFVVPDTYDNHEHLDYDRLQSNAI